MPVVLARLEEDVVAGPDDLDRATLALAEADTLGAQIVWPCGWVCQAVRAPGVKWTAAAPTGEASPGAAIVSM
jgi:hypothetical protein